MSWPITSLLDLQGSRYVSFGALATNALNKFAVSLYLRLGGTTWAPNGTRILVTRAGQFVFRMQAPSSGYLLNFGVTQSNGSTVFFRGVPNTPENLARLVGRKVLHLWATYEVVSDGQGSTVAVVRIGCDGIEFQVTGTGVMPTAFKAVAASVDVRMGSTDSLSTGVGNLALWTLGAIPSPAVMQAIWNRNAPCDLLTGVGEDPLGASVAISPLPSHWWPCSGDVLPDVAPRLGSVHGTCLPTSPALVLKTAYSPCSGADAIALRRRALNNGAEGYPPPGSFGGSVPYKSVPSIEYAGNGDLLVAFSQGSGHSTTNQSAMLARITNRGISLPWPNGQAWPGCPDVVQYALQTTESARGNAIQRLPSGRIVHFVGYGYESAARTPPPAGPVPDSDPSIQGWQVMRHSDDDGYSWIGDPLLGTPWRYVWPGAPIGSPNSGRVITLPDGRRMRGVYRKPPGASYRNLETIITSDDLAWSFGPKIHDGAIDGKQWEEPQLGWISRDHPVTGGAGWVCIARNDDAGGAHLYIMYATEIDLPVTWTAPVVLIGGYNSPVWMETEDALLLLTRAPSPSNPPNLDECPSMLHVFRDGFQTLVTSEWLGRGEDAANMGHGMRIRPSDGQLVIAVAHAQLGSAYGGWTHLEILDKIKTW